MKWPCWSIAGARCATTGKACTCRYRSISSDLQRPRSRILSVSMLAHNNAIAPEEHRERMEISVSVMPYVVPKAWAVALRAEVRWVVVMDLAIPCS